MSTHVFPTSFHCKSCTCPFHPSEGGHCGACGGLFCAEHLRRNPGPVAPGQARMLCDSCLADLRSAGAAPHPLRQRVLWVAHPAVYGLIACWAYTSYMYDWLNVGGGQSAFMAQWIVLSDIVPYVALSAWIALTLAPLLLHRWMKLSKAQIHTHLLSCLAVCPTLLFAADWFFHLGFPRQTPM